MPARCALAGHGHTTALPRAVMKSRRLMPNPEANEHSEDVYSIIAA
jgi:hypothetical protein